MKNNGGLKIKMQEVSSINSEEQKIRKIAEKAFDVALKFYYYPSLPTPNLIFDYSKKTGFFIDFESYQITLNLANTHDIILTQEYHDYFFSLSLHEISHYVFCPYDNFTNMILLNSVLEAKVHQYFAPIIVNIFSDLLIDFKNHQFFPQIMEWEMQKHIKENETPEQFKKASKLWKILIHCYEILWDIQFIQSLHSDTQIHDVCSKICKLIISSVENEDIWSKNLKKIAKLLKPILKEECSLKENLRNKISSDSSNHSQTGESQQFLENPLQIPDDVKESFGDLTQTIDYNRAKSEESEEVQNSKDKGRTIDDDFENFARNHEFGRFQAVAQLYGINDSREKQAIWYRSQAKNLLKFEITIQKPGGSIPVSIEKWRLGDPLEDLDIVQSLISSPILIPNVTTKKWNYLLGPGTKIHEQLPDLMIVLDSSGSMDWNFHNDKISGKFHVALLASFAALHYSLSQGSYAAVINFSEKTRSTKWSNDIHYLEKHLLDYQGSGTILPSQKMINLAKKADSKSCILVITDFEIQNWNQSFSDFQNLLQMGNMLICFFIDGYEEELEQSYIKSLKEMGAKFYCINRKSDLIGLVIREVRSIYHK